MRLKIFSLIIAVLLFSTATAKAVSGERFADNGEFLIDTTITPVPAPDYQRYPVVSFDGSNYLVVWQDKRNGNYDIYGCRVSPQGSILDTIGIPISTAPNDQYSPAVFFDGTNYFVVWADTRNGGYDIYGSRLTKGGFVIDTAGIPINTAAGDQYRPAVCFDGSNYLIVWQDKRSGNWDIYGCRVRMNGVVLDTTPIAISTALRSQVSPAVCFDGTNYLVVWADARNGGYDIYGSRLTRRGAVIDTAGIPISTAMETQQSPAVSFDGTNFLVTWTDARNGGWQDIYGARVTRDGVVLDTAGIAISTAKDHQGFPGLYFDGTNYLIVWQDNRHLNLDIYGARVTPDGVVLDTAGIAISTAAKSQRFPAVCFDGTNFLVVCEDTRSGVDIYGSRVTKNGVALDTAGFAISTAVNCQERPAVGFDGMDYLVVWQENRGGHSDIYGARVGLEDGLVDPQIFAISTAPYDQHSPSVSFGGIDYLVVWEDYRNNPDIADIYCSRVSQNGTVRDTGGIPISTAKNHQHCPGISFDGTNYLVVWEDWRSGGNPDIYGARVTPDGLVLDTAGIPISTAIESQQSPVVCFGGTNFLVVWQDNRNGNYDIYGARVTPDGVVLDTEGVVISIAQDSQVSPALSFDGTNFLVVWQDKRNGNYDIYGVLYQEAIPPPPGGIPISTGGDEQSSPAVLFDGTNYIVMWQDNRSGSFDIWGARVSPQGVILDKGPVVVQEDAQRYPALAQGQGGQRLLVYQGWTGKVGGKTYNTYRIWGKLNPNVEIEERFQPAANRPRQTATIVRNFLRLETVFGHRSSVLFDVSGRKVLELKPGANDLRHLSPGVYFIRGGAGIERKVVITE